MSLLLEALKKAEKAKEEAQRRERGEAGAGLRIEDDPPASARPVLTRAELPDIKQPLEILSDDIAPKEPALREPALREPGPRGEPARPAEPQAAERAVARKVFEAKIREPDPRLPFFITLGVLAAFAVGTAGYFWYQLRPPPPLINANPARSPNEAPPVQVAQVQSAPTRIADPAAAIPGLPSAATPPRAEPAPAAPVPAVSVAPKPKPAARTARRVRPVEPPPAPVAAVGAPITSRPAPQIHPKVESGYAAYVEGDLTTAHADYQEALRDDRSNRDALLGLAAVEVRTGRHESAEATYLRLLQLDPGDAHAQAGLIALRATRLDPLATESRVKSMLAADPEAKVLHFTLGNQLAQQGRWSEAQQEYFKAYAASPDNPDFAYNLAVSLDHLRQPKLALEYYRRAVALAAGRSPSFDVAAARHRASQLEP